MPAAASVPEDDVPRFKPATVQAIMKTSFKDGRTQVSNHALTLCAEYIRLFTLDAIHRSAKDAKREQPQDIASESAQLDVEHLQANTAALLIDYGT